MQAPIKLLLQVGVASTRALVTGGIAIECPCNDRVTSLTSCNTPLDLSGPYFRSRKVNRRLCDDRRGDATLRQIICRF